ncbi:MAG: O-antigen ligase family protein [Ruminococcaceae bacterium]|nr:O-antigen ligase family protein [Oscillospiraceae bacterium]
MAIWIWIILAWVLSYLALGKKKVSFEHLIWILMPVDMYGISVAGATIKPYMIFCLILLVRMFIRGGYQLHATKWLMAAGVLSGAVVVVNIANNASNSALKAALLLTIVWGCCFVYCNCCGKETWKDVPNVCVATGIGYGSVFIISYILLKAGMLIPGVATANRMSSGLFLLTSNFYDGALVQIYRLRGTMIDPNSVIGVFALCSIICFLRIINRNGTVKEWCGIGVSAICILLTGSRMGLLCFAILFIMTLVAGYRIANIRVRNYMKLVNLVLVFILIFLLIVTDFVHDAINSLLTSYDNRSGLTDEYGRFSIWKDVITIFFDHNPLLGIGMGQTRYYTSTARDCHNNWLSIVCENGLIVGGALCLLFVVAAISGINKSKHLSGKNEKELTLSLALGLLTIMISLISVDNVTYSYLWFCAALLTVI